jgi:hypothetical protein
MRLVRYMEIKSDEVISRISHSLGLKPPSHASLVEGGSNVEKKAKAVLYCIEAVIYISALKHSACIEIDANRTRGLLC